MNTIPDIDRLPTVVDASSTSTNATTDLHSVESGGHTVMHDTHSNAVVLDTSHINSKEPNKPLKDMSIQQAQEPMSYIDQDLNTETSCNILHVLITYNNTVKAPSDIIDMTPQLVLSIVNDPKAFINENEDYAKAHAKVSQFLNVQTFCDNTVTSLIQRSYDPGMTGKIGSGSINTLMSKWTNLDTIHVTLTDLTQKSVENKQCSELELTKLKHFESNIKTFIDALDDKRTKYDDANNALSALTAAEADLYKAHLEGSISEDAIDVLTQKVLDAEQIVEALNMKGSTETIVLQAQKPRPISTENSGFLGGNRAPGDIHMDTKPTRPSDIDLDQKAKPSGVLKQIWNGMKSFLKRFKSSKRASRMQSELTHFDPSLKPEGLGYYFKSIESDKRAEAIKNYFKDANTSVLKEYCYTELVLPNKNRVSLPSSQDNLDAHQIIEWLSQDPKLGAQILNQILIKLEMNETQFVNMSKPIPNTSQAAPAP